MSVWQLKVGEFCFQPVWSFRRVVMGYKAETIHAASGARWLLQKLKTHARTDAHTYLWSLVVASTVTSGPGTSCADRNIGLRVLPLESLT